MIVVSSVVRSPTSRLSKVLLTSSALLASCTATPRRHVDTAATATTHRRVASTSVCHFDGATALPVAGADGTILVPPNHPLISYLGRLDCHAAGGPLLGWVGSSIRLRFVGTGLDLKLKDFGHGTPQTTNYYDVSIDDAPPRVIEVSPKQELYSIATGLSDGVHQLELFKRVEAGPGGHASAGKAQVLGFVLHGTDLLPVQLPARRLEFIGDSITVGYGNEVSTNDPGSAPYTTFASNGHKAYGALTAARLGAQYMAVAYSGRGVSRNYADVAGQLMPEMYLQSVPEEPSASAWDPAQYTPDAVITNLGANDFSTPGVDRAAFVRKYTGFLTQLRGYYPNAQIVVAVGPTLSDDSPPGQNTWTNARADVKAVVDARIDAGDSRIHLSYFEPQTAPYGEDWHPTVATHEKLAQQLSTSLKAILGW